jgi:hypothetical protein
LHTKKGGNKMKPNIVATTKTQMDEFCTCHMAGAREVFESFTYFDSKMPVEVGMGTKHEVKGYGIVLF